MRQGLFGRTSLPTTVLVIAAVTAAVTAALTQVWKFWLRQGKDQDGELKPITFKLNATGTGSMKKAIVVECEKMNVVCVDTKVALPGESHKS